MSVEAELRWWAGERRRINNSFTVDLYSSSDSAPSTTKRFLMHLNNSIIQTTLTASGPLPKITKQNSVRSTASVCFCPSLSVFVCLYLAVHICLCQCQYLSACLYQSVSASICLYLAVPVCLSLSVCHSRSPLGAVKAESAATEQFIHSIIADICIAPLQMGLLRSAPNHMQRGRIM